MHTLFVVHFCHLIVDIDCERALAKSTDPVLACDNSLLLFATVVN